MYKKKSNWRQNYILLIVGFPFFFEGLEAGNNVCLFSQEMEKFFNCPLEGYPSSHQVLY